MSVFQGNIALKTNKLKLGCFTLLWCGENMKTMCIFSQKSTASAFTFKKKLISIRYSVAK